MTSHDVKTTFYEVPREVLGQNQPLRIVLVGDTHIGVNSSPQLYRDMVDRINEQDPDIVVVAGDIVTSSYGAMRDPDTYSSILNGRICGEGLMVFAIGGMAAVYLLVPLFDSALSFVKVKKVAAVTLILLAVFAYDMVYSHNHPNIGEGITDYDAYQNSGTVTTEQQWSSSGQYHMF